jgi:hypothetical protein
VDVSQLQLEERVCAGGCGKTFRCLPTSKATTARSDCAHVCKREPLSVAQARVRQATGVTPPPEVVERIEERRSAGKRAGMAIVAAVAAAAALAPPVAPADQPAPPPVVATVERDGEDKMTLWLRCVDEAKQEVSKLHAARARIVDLALRCCDIQWGGGAHWSGHEGVYTARRFAKEIGVNYKTLMNWLTARRVVADNLPPGEWKEEDFRFAQRAIKRLGAAAPRQKVLDEFRRQRDGAKTKYKLGSIVQWARSHRNFIKASNVAELPRDDLLALRMLCADTVALIDTKIKETSP